MVRRCMQLRKIHKERRQKYYKELLLEDSLDSSISVNYTEDDDDGEELCEICNNYGKSETWYACSRCHKWAHAACTGLKRSAKHMYATSVLKIQ